MVLTAKVDFKKLIIILAAAAALILALLLLVGGKEETAQTAAPSLSGNDGRVQFLKDLGWEVAASPVESTQVRIPEETSEVFDRYNTLQKGQGYDLSQYGGKKVMRFVYKIENYPGATAPVYATMLVYKNQLIGGDITDTSPGGKIQGFKLPAAPESVPTETAPATTSAQ